MNALVKYGDRYGLYALLALFVLVVGRNAWAGDDAYITLRTVDNFVNGLGLTWNAGERVQAYTHPLWMFLLSLCYLVTRETFFTTIYLSIALSAIAVYLLAFRIAGSKLAAAAVIVALTLSKAYVDYSTSGLENPLSHLLLLIFFLLFLSGDRSRRTIFLLGLVAALAALTRMDNILFVGPPLGYLIWRHRDHRTLLIILTGFLPLIAWRLFSLFYYGFLWPNTAYAKLGAGVDWTRLVEQGLYYILVSLRIDPLTVVLIAAGIILAVTSRDSRALLIAAGILLYLVYVVRIGGCFMSGRLLSEPLLISLIVLSQVRLRPVLYRGLPLIAAMLLLGLVPPRSPVCTTAGDGGEYERSKFGRGIVDERGWYFPTTSLINASQFDQMPAHRYAQLGRYQRTPITARSTVGFYGYFAGPETYVIDLCGLGDPLLARLPFDTSQTWRIGHNFRAVPAGYKETILFGRNLITNPDLAQYYERLALIVRGELFDRERLTTIVRFNLGQYDHLLDSYTRAR